MGARSWAPVVIATDASNSYFAWCIEDTYWNVTLLIQLPCKVFDTYPAAMIRKSMYERVS